jgi:hypothetical protein
VDSTEEKSGRVIGNSEPGPRNSSSKLDGTAKRRASSRAGASLLRAAESAARLIDRGYVARRLPGCRSDAEIVLGSLRPALGRAQSEQQIATPGGQREEGAP